MTQRTINLYDGLEALYYFDSDYYDGTANEIKDKSGHGRHAEASGGPTVGVEGPNSFESTSFDGSDDYFDVPDYGVPAGSGWTVAFLAKRDKGERFNYITNRYQNYERGVVWFRYGRPSYDQGSNDIRASASLSPGEFGVGVIRRREGLDEISAHLVRDNSLNTGIGSTSRSDLSVYAIADAANTDKRLDGNLSFVGIWSRALSDAEMQYMGNLTAPRRAQL